MNDNSSAHGNAVLYRSAVARRVSQHVPTWQPGSLSSGYAAEASRCMPTREGIESPTGPRADP